MRTKKIAEGFLLIEFLTALIILSALVIVVMLSLARGIGWSQEAQLRLQALNASTTTLEQWARENSMINSKKQNCIVTIAKSDAAINQKAIDLLIPGTKKMEGAFKIVVVTSEWESISGKKKRVQLMTGIVDSENRGGMKIDKTGVHTY